MSIGDSEAAGKSEDIRSWTHEFARTARIVGTRPIGQYPLWCIIWGTQPRRERSVILSGRRDVF
jgi:hypothetical protein